VLRVFHVREQSTYKKEQDKQKKGVGRYRGPLNYFLAAAAFSIKRLTGGGFLGTGCPYPSDSRTGGTTTGKARPAQV
jgi:hypothetical protein